MRRITTTFLFLAVLCSGCAYSIPRGSDLEFSLPRINHRQATQNWVEMNTRDPGRTRIQILDNQPAPGYITSWFQTQGPQAWVWRAGLNGPNAFGGMTGWQQWFFAHDGENIWGWRHTGIPPVRRVD